LDKNLCVWGIGFVLFFLNTSLFKTIIKHRYILYILTTGLTISPCAWSLDKPSAPYQFDVFNNENESFQQETKLMENEYFVNLPPNSGTTKTAQWLDQYCKPF
jgi:hypothetical protein